MTYQSDIFGSILQFVQENPKDVRLEERKTRNGMRLLLKIANKNQSKLYWTNFSISNIYWTARISDYQLNDKKHIDKMFDALFFFLLTKIATISNLVSLSISLDIK